MNDIITSKDNKLVKFTKSLYQKKSRDLEGCYIVEGIKMVQEALIQRDIIRFIVICPTILNQVNGGRDILDISSQSKHQVITVNENIFKFISDTQTPQGILAVIIKRSTKLKDFELKKNGRYILLDAVQDPGNVGTIIRTADAIGFDGIFLSKGCADVYNSKTLRSTMGSVYRVDLFQDIDLEILISCMKLHGIKIFASSLEADNVHFKADFCGGIGLIIGNEANGISKKVLEMADVKIKIPMRGGAESLNASVAAGILMYEIERNNYR